VVPPHRYRFDMNINCICCSWVW